MDRKEVIDLILEEKLVILFRRVPVEKMGKLAQALVRGGIKLLELTFDQQAQNPTQLFSDSVKAVRDAVGDRLCIGAGTVLNCAQVVAAYNAGAKYVISPCTKEDVVQLTVDLGMVSIPGALTPSEIVHAWDCGADIVKLFPADDAGFHYIWNLKGPLPHIPLMTTGGVNVDTIPKFLGAGASAVGTGITVIDRKMLENNDFVGIEKLARAHVEAVKAYS